MTKNQGTACCGKCEKAQLGTCSKIERMLAALKVPAKEQPREV